MLSPVDAAVCLYLPWVERLKLDVFRYDHSDDVSASIRADGNHLTLAGPPDRIVTVLRELADKIEAMTAEVAA